MGSGTKHRILSKFCCSPKPAPGRAGAGSGQVRGSRFPTLRGCCSQSPELPQCGLEPGAPSRKGVSNLSTAGCKGASHLPAPGCRLRSPQLTSDPRPGASARPPKASGSSLRRPGTTRSPPRPALPSASGQRPCSSVQPPIHGQRPFPPPPQHTHTVAASLDACALRRPRSAFRPPRPTPQRLNAGHRQTSASRREPPRAG